VVGSSLFYLAIQTNILYSSSPCPVRIIIVDLVTIVNICRREKIMTRNVLHLPVTFCLLGSNIFHGIFLLKTPLIYVSPLGQRTKLLSIQNISLYIALTFSYPGVSSSPTYCFDDQCSSVMYFLLYFLLTPRSNNQS
jgi:hypothetical protein